MAFVALLSKIDARDIYLFMLSVLLIVMFMFFYFYLNAYLGLWWQEGIIRRGKSKTKVAITFDDGPHPEYTARILDVLRRKDAKATFFLTGKNAEKYPEIVKRIKAEGHDIGNHTYSHINLSPTKFATARKEINLTEHVLREIIGEEPLFFRPPRGVYDQKLRRMLVNKGYSIVLWTITTHDWRNPGVEHIVKRVKRAKGGDIILMHDSGALMKAEGADRTQTVMALPKIIDELRKKGLKPVKISEFFE